MNWIAQSVLEQVETVVKNTVSKMRVHIVRRAIIIGEENNKAASI